MSSEPLRFSAKGQASVRLRLALSADDFGLLLKASGQSVYTWHRQVSMAEFVELNHFYRTTDAPVEQRPWLASVWRKPMR